MSETKWITFRLAARQSPATKRWDVLAKGGSPKETVGTPLGIIQWWGAWRRYAFFPTAGTLFEPTCLRDLATFCEEQTRAHKPAQAEVARATRTW